MTKKWFVARTFYDEPLPPAWRGFRKTEDAIILENSFRAMQPGATVELRVDRGLDSAAGLRAARALWMIAKRSAGRVSSPSAEYVVVRRGLVVFVQRKRSENVATAL